MKKIKLHGKAAKGKYEYALVDDDYYPWLDKYYWIAKKDTKKEGQKEFIYAVTTIWTPSGKSEFRMHRYIMNATNIRMVDHQDGDTINNQRYNLRIVTRVQNGQNIHKSIYKGCSYDSRSNIWWGRIKVDGKQVGLGCYDTEFDCAVAYNHAALKYFGEYASFNKIPDWRNIQPKLHIKKRYIYKSNTSGVPGVSWNKKNNCWNASIGLRRIGIEGSRVRKTLYMGSFKDKQQAIKARRDAEIKYLGKSDIPEDAPNGTS